MATHSSLGPGLDEEFYHQDLVARLTAKGVSHLSKPRRDLVYRGHVADTFEADLVIEDGLIVELKALRGDFANEHLIQTLCYQKFWRTRTGLLLDFGKAGLVRKRTLYESRTAALEASHVPDFTTDPGLAFRVIAALDECLREIGLGYRETTWFGLALAAFRAEGMACSANPVGEVKTIGSIGFRCIAVEEVFAVSVTALGEGVSATDRARLQTCLRWLDLPFGLAFHFGKEKAEVRFVSRPA